MTLGYAFNRDYAQTNHAKRRARERYGITLTPALNNRVSMMIGAGRVAPLKLEFSKHDIYEFDWRMIEPDLPEPLVVKIAFNGQSGNIVTFLPLDWTPAAGFEHFITGQEERIEAARQAELLVERNRLSKINQEFNELHPMPASTGDLKRDVELLTAALARLQQDHDSDPTFKMLRGARLMTMSRMIGEANREIKRANREKHALKLAEAKEQKKERNRQHNDLMSAIAQSRKNNLPKSDIVDDRAHALAIAINEMVEDEMLRVRIFRHARSLYKKIPHQESELEVAE